MPAARRRIIKPALAARCAGFVKKLGGGRLADTLDAPELVAEFAAAGEAIGAAYAARESGAAVRQIMALADRANAYVAERAPWALAKDPERTAEVLPVCTTALNLFRLLSLYLAPALPDTTAKVGEWLHGLPDWSQRERPLLGVEIAPYQNLLARVDEAAVAALS